MQFRPAEIRNQPNNNNKHLKTSKATDSGESAAFFFVKWVLRPPYEAGWHYIK